MPQERQLPQHTGGAYYCALQPLDDSIGPESYPHFICKEIEASETKPGWSPGAWVSPTSALTSCVILSKSLGLNFLICKMLEEAEITHDPFLSCTLTL